MDTAGMTTNRVPIDRPPTMRVSERALDIYEAMRRLRCTCLPVIPERYWDHKQCASCRRWSDLQSELNAELGCLPWQWPCVYRRSSSTKHTGPLDWRQQDMHDRTVALKAALKARRTAAKEKGTPDAVDGKQDVDSVT
jgi:hypothetical protein